MNPTSVAQKLNRDELKQPEKNTSTHFKKTANVINQFSIM
jgi:hypothetical protein